MSTLERERFGEGIPDLQSCYLDSNIRFVLGDGLILSFHRSDVQSGIVTYYQVILPRAQLISADVELAAIYTPTVLSFPRLISCNVKEVKSKRNLPRGVLTMTFDNGKITIRFETAFHLERKHKITIPTERFEKQIEDRLNEEKDDPWQY